MVRPFLGFAIGLAAVAQLTQQQAYQLLAKGLSPNNRVNLWAVVA